MYDKACQWAASSTCPTRPAGAVVETTSGRLYYGYEGAPHGCAHCEATGCDLVDQKCQNAVRAETNALLRVAKCEDDSTAGATLYVSEPLDPASAGLVINAGVACVVCASPVAQSVQAKLVLANVALEERDNART